MNHKLPNPNNAYDLCIPTQWISKKVEKLNQNVPSGFHNLTILSKDVDISDF